MVATNAVMAQLGTLGTEQNRKVYKRHGIGDTILGVSYANLKLLAKQHKNDHALAQELWASGVHDARILALMVADPRQADDAMLEEWAGDLHDYVVAEALAGFVAKTPFARAKAEAWSRSPEESVATAGWTLFAHLALAEASLPDDYFAGLLDTIERTLHSSQNRVRYAMNSALIAIGARNETLERQALAVATHIGKVEVDHGETGCKTPDAVAYIAKATARRKR